MSDALLIVATILGPILAVQAQKAVERATEQRRQKLSVFHVLMATRAARVSPEHVQALNRIELQFGGGRVFGLILWQTAAERAVIEAWRIYYDKLSNKGEQTEDAIKAWNERCGDLFIDLMYAMSKALGYSFDKVQLMRGAYYPVAHSEADLAQLSIRRNFAALLSGKQAINMNVVGLPLSPEAVELQQRLQKLLLKTVSPEGDIQLPAKPSSDTD
jgi:hypothetical protein